MSSILAFPSQLGFLRSVSIVVVLGAVAGCDTPAVPSDAPVSQDQLPPTDLTQLDEWLAARSWEDWDCEIDSHPATGISPHGTNRICQNVIVTRNLDGTGDFPVGATLVKESFDGGGNSFALFVETRLDAGSGPSSWYFLRRETASGAIVDNEAFCADCHARSRRDFVWSTVP